MSLSSRSFAVRGHFSDRTASRFITDLYLHALVRNSSFAFGTFSKQRLMLSPAAIVCSVTCAVLFRHIWIKLRIVLSLSIIDFHFDFGLRPRFFPGLVVAREDTRQIRRCFRSLSRFAFQPEDE